MGKMWWAVLSDSDDILDYVEAETEEEAARVYAEKAHMPPEDTKYLYAIPGDRIRDDVEIEGWLLSAIEFDPEFAFGPEEPFPETWKEYRKAVAKLKAKDIHPEDIVGWVRLDSVLDLWAPVVK